MSGLRFPRRAYCLLLLSVGLACADDQPADGSGTDSGATPTSDDGSTSLDITTSGIGSDTSAGTAEGTTTTTPPGTDDDTTDTLADSTSEGESSTTDGCAEDCDDGIACTEDSCVDGVCEHIPTDAICDDGVDCTIDICDGAVDCIHTPSDMVCDDGMGCTTESCDPVAGCVATPDDMLCDDGVSCTNDVCDAVMGCIITPMDMLCDDGVMCTVDSCDPMMDCLSVPDSGLCAPGGGCAGEICDPVLDCTMATTILVLNGSNGASTAPEDAVTALGYIPVVATDEVTFVAAYDAGGFGAIVFDVPSLWSPVPVAIQTRLDSWVAAGERLVFGYWDLDGDMAMQTTLDLNVLASVDPTLPVFPSAGAPIDLFNATEVFPAPITYPDNWSDNGDQIEPAGTGFIAGRFNDAMAGPGAIVVNNSDRVITNGFLITEIGESVVDGDGDGINDGEELLRNELEYICAAP